MKLERAVRSVLYPITKPEHRRRLIAARDTGVSLIAAGRSKVRSQRPLPDFIVAGVQKGGTTFLYQEMLRHPEIRGSLTKEVHFFDGNFDKGVDWYSGMFPRSSSNARVIRGEASPAYIFHPAAVRRIAETLPDPRLDHRRARPSAARSVALQTRAPTRVRAERNIRRGARARGIAASPRSSID